MSEVPNREAAASTWLIVAAWMSKNGEGGEASACRTGDESQYVEQRNGHCSEPRMVGTLAVNGNSFS